MKTNINQLIKEIKEELISCSPSSHEAGQQASWMLQELTKKSESQLLLEETIELSQEQEKKLKEWIHQRVSEQKPIQYVFGHTPFCNLDILVEQPVLIPRPETEELVFWLIKKLELLKNEKLNILDLGTGSGCIALALARALPDASVVGTDINLKAIELARKNAEHNNIKNISFFESDFYSKIPVEQKFDLIVSNPPYISDKEWDNLPQNVRLWEDYKALVADKQGFECFEKIIFGAKSYLKENSKLKEFNIPQIVLEIGKGQENRVSELFQQAQFKNMQVFADLGGVNRWITATL